MSREVVVRLGCSDECPFSGFCTKLLTPTEVAVLTDKAHGGIQGIVEEYRPKGHYEGITQRNEDNGFCVPVRVELGGESATPNISTRIAISVINSYRNLRGLSTVLGRNPECPGMQYSNITEKRDACPHGAQLAEFSSELVKNLLTPERNGDSTQ